MTQNRHHRSIDGHAVESPFTLPRACLHIEVGQCEESQAVQRLKTHVEQGRCSEERQVVVGDPWDSAHQTEGRQQRHVVQRPGQLQLSLHQFHHQHRA
eukprot:Skav216187  [mRNA]  locus=scaffold2249:216066:217478:- [translate_table: standard]